MATTESAVKTNVLEPHRDFIKHEGPRDPADGQTVYLGSEKGEGWWRYPSADGFVRHYQHDCRAITETEDSWPAWVWHDLGNEYVCLESVKYPSYYLYHTMIGKKGIAYSTAPASEDWARLRVVDKRCEPRGLYVNLVGQNSYEKGYVKGIRAFVYIPPMSEEYRVVAEVRNNSTTSMKYKHTYQCGVTHTEKTTESKVEVKLSANEAIRNIIKIYGQSWTAEKSRELEEKQMHENYIVVPPGKKLIIKQKVAKYGLCEWRSGVFDISTLDL